MWPYIKNVLIGLDQFVNTLAGGWPDETLSARSYRCFPTAAKVIDLILFFDPEHCKSSYESEKLRLQTPPEER